MESGRSVFFHTNINDMTAHCKAKQSKIVVASRIFIDTNDDIQLSTLKVLASDWRSFKCTALHNCGMIITFAPI
ncbi:hypothetical protein [Okeania sp. SIO2C2]|uniref:hypothetical protein n=1 Tax=Okeania sp. SIO2C2 TaxID=2607787 RepID=UPI00257E2650|nr:hypothetical protein [Okeania sp. SIO2C2]